MADISEKKLKKIGLPFPDWHIVQEIGSGTFGSVFRIEDRRGAVCALKVIPVPRLEADAQEKLRVCGGDIQMARAAFDDQIRRILAREIETAKQCAGCRNIFTIHEDVVVDDPDDPVVRLIMVRMELLTDLKTYINRPGRKQRDVLQMMDSVASALVFLEGKRIIHRDIKPANIMVDAQGVYKLTDFGEARVIQGEGNHTIARGTPFYMAPEVWKSGHYDNRADIYSLGIVAYYFLNGMRYPFAQNGIRAQEGFQRRMEGEGSPPIPGVDPRINKVILKCIAFHPDDRYRSASELLKDLRSLLNDSSIGRLPLTGRDPGRAASSTQGKSAPTPRPASGGGLSTTAIVLIVVGAVMVFMLFVGVIASSMSSRLGRDLPAFSRQNSTTGGSPTDALEWPPEE